MGFLKKLGGFVSKGVGAATKLTSWAAKATTNPVGAIAEAAQGVKLIKESKGDRVSSAKTSSGIENQQKASANRSETNSGGGISDWFKKAWEWVKNNKKTIIIVVVVGVVGWLVYTFMFAKRGVRRKSPRRVAQASRMRAARAAKRKK